MALSELAMVLPRRASDYPICNCAHSYFLSPFQTPFFLKNMSFATITKPWSHCYRTNKNVVHTGTWCPLLCPSTRSRPCTRAPAPCPNSSGGMLEKMSVFTLVPSEYRTRAPCPGTKCGGCPTFPRATKEIGHKVCRHAGYLFH